MNEFKHMPGYWFVTNDRGTLVTANNGELHNWQMSNVCQPYGFTDEQRLATAKLIATAPEMINALMLISPLVDVFINNTPSGIERIKLCDINILIKNAIDKATK